MERRGSGRVAVGQKPGSQEDRAQADAVEQARRKFCAGFAYAGIRSVSGSDAIESVADPADLAVDRAAARRLVAYCGAIAVSITAVFVVLPF